MKGGMLRKTIPLIVLTILLASLPSVQALTESLYVDSYTGDHNTWDEKNEPSPYLADESTGWVRESKSTGAVVGYFGFVDPSGSGTIISVTLYIECKGDDTNDHIDVYVDCGDGGGWVEEGVKIVDQLTYDWETLDLTTRLDSWADIQNAQIYLYYQGVGGGDDIWARRAYLYVDYTEAGEAYTREVTQTVSWAGANERVWSTTRDVSQGVSLASDSERVWSTSRSVSTAIVLTSDSLRSWSLSRVVNQALSFTSNTFVTMLQLIMRSVSLQVTLTSDATRSWILLRELSQSISLATNSERLATFSRAVSQSISLISNAFVEMLSLIERTVSLSLTTSFNANRILTTIREVSLSMTTAFNANRLWSAIRGVSQNLLAQMSAGGLLTPEDPGDPHNPDGDTPSVFNVVNEFNTSMIMMNVLTLLATGVYIFKGQELEWGAIATFLWFVTALATLVNDPNSWITARVYGGFGAIFIVLTIVSVIRRLDPEDTYFDDWE